MKVSNEQLVNEVRNLRAKEKEVLHTLLLHLAEVDKRKLYRDEGYSSFFSYLETGLGYSKSAAERRVKAARILQKRPELYKKLCDAELSFTSLVELGRCNDKQVDTIITQASEKDTGDIAHVIAQERAPIVKHRQREKVRVVRTTAKEPAPILELTSNDKSTPAAGVDSDALAYEIAFQADEEFMALYREAKALAGGFGMKEVFLKLLKDYTNRNSPKEKIKRRAARKQKIPASKGRYIPAATKDEISVRDGGRCTYVAPDGTRCSCTQNLEYDHIKPFALGGDSRPDNLRLLCRAHNQLMAERVFGEDYMSTKRAR